MDGYNGISNNYFIANTKNKKVMWQYCAQDFDFAMSSSMGGGRGGNANGGNANINGAANANGAVNTGGTNNATGAGTGGTGGNTGNATNTNGVAANNNIGNNGNGGNNGGNGNNGGGGGFGSLSADVFAFNSKTRPLTSVIFTASNNITYALYVGALIAGINPNITLSRVAAYTRLTSSVVARDLYFQAVSGQTQASFLTNVEATKTWITTRYLNVTQQYTQVLATFPTSSPTSAPSSTTSENSANTGNSTTSKNTTNSKSSTGRNILITGGVLVGVVSVSVGTVFGYHWIKNKKSYTHLRVESDEESASAL